MAYAQIALAIASGVATITLNRPDAFNALTLAMGQELLDAAIEASEDPAVRCIVLTGSGKAFCGGGDVKDFVHALPRIGVHIKHLTTSVHGAVSRLIGAPKPVITAVNGVAAGGGFALALAGDLVIAAEAARFTMAYSRIGATPDGSSTYWLPRLVGVRRAVELFYTNRVLTAAEALAWGIVSRVVPDSELAEAVRQQAVELAAGPTLALGRGKRLFHGSTTESLETQMERESEAIARSGHTEDFAEGVRAFAEKRPPAFRGR
jgi:2-(1,2-epoxy-1,2-dihydrophenyl)acetyl-CoA isomerase